MSRLLNRGIKGSVTRFSIEILPALTYAPYDLAISGGGGDSRAPPDTLQPRGAMALESPALTAHSLCPVFGFFFWIKYYKYKFICGFFDGGFFTVKQIVLRDFIKKRRGRRAEMIDLEEEEKYKQVKFHYFLVKNLEIFLLYTVFLIA